MKPHLDGKPRDHYPITCLVPHTGESATLMCGQGIMQGHRVGDGVQAYEIVDLEIEAIPFSAPLSLKEVAEQYNDLASAQPATAQKAILSLVSRGPANLPQLMELHEANKPLGTGEVHRLTLQLDDDRFKIRKEAKASLMRLLRPGHLPLLRKAKEDATSIEVQISLSEVIDHIKQRANAYPFNAQSHRLHYILMLFEPEGKRLASNLPKTKDVVYFTPGPQDVHPALLHFIEGGFIPAPRIQPAPGVKP